MSKFIILGLIIISIFWLLNRSAQTKKSAQVNIEIGQQFLEANKLEEGVQVTPSGLQYKVLTEGTGEEHPTSRSKVTVHYHGTLIDGTVFDSSVDRGETISFGLNQVIKGWTEGLQLMVVGQKTRFYIPSELGYQNRSTGSIPPGSVLIFDVELFEFK
ncbi:FKBP-type peptidyl-prolyl cis-trans isomerase [Psychrobium sp. 1_MG-2023]|uniref:FKBP-type peptidyl-prolyl cis-trans isomerase n=1 Tax=Psychrobium sp. 1_MG-2023 TaxID=3062624 RepID=UPI000C3497B5|nr:FKBP-type peptidyl-prolyl cis-trans isomerase [Psychrobium sp. 1_MG-2023]MDP2561584.1 FKBP-type peptidyl-prolyl cis-trans isomerase [Psychrobium sp. 1_MG-2023]PKF55044.1 peptidylprolyl isomerase [Alteromonadales bacterium alter-6D02]